MAVKNNLSGKPTNRVDLKATTTKQTVHHLDWIFMLSNCWLIGGLYLDGWAHLHFPELESFFTPWHGVLYSGYLVNAAVLLTALIGWHRQGKPWLQALPPGYNLALAGVVLFASGGIVDGLWHSLLGIEVSTEALLSPPHLVLLTAGILIISGPLRSSWQRSAGATAGLPALISTGLILAILNFFTLFANPFGETYAALGQGPGTGTSSGLVDLLRARGIAAVMIQAALLMFMLLLVMRRWQLRPGSLTLLVALPIAMISFIRNQSLAVLPVAIMLVGLGTGLAAEFLYYRLRPGLTGPWAYRLFSMLVPLVLFSLYFLVIGLLPGLWWSPALWGGSIIYAGAIGLGLSLLVVPPELPAYRDIK